MSFLLLSSGRPQPPAAPAVYVPAVRGPGRTGCSVKLIPGSSLYFLPMTML